MEHYTIRDSCILCNHTDFSEDYFADNFHTYLSYSLYTERKSDAVSIPFNVIYCKNCYTVQTKYIGDISIIYETNHVDTFGSVKNSQIIEFSNFILENKDIISPIEIGACTHAVGDIILNSITSSYTIIDPGYKGIYIPRLHIINDYCENVDLNSLEGNTIILSNVFEHFYEPISILKKISSAHNIKYIYLNHPDFEYYCKNGVYNILNFEHIYYIELEFLKKLFNLYGFQLESYKPHDNQTTFLKFNRCITNNISTDITFKHGSSIEDTKQYFKEMHDKISKMNVMLNTNTDSEYYIWPASAHSVALFMNGLEWNKLSGVLDNSPHKVGKILYGYNLTCQSFNTMITSDVSKPVTIFISGAGNYIKEIDIKSKTVNIVYVNDL